MGQYSGIVAAVIASVGAAFFLAWAVVHRLYHDSTERDPVDHPDAGSNQSQYMREVRIRQQEDISAVTYGGKRFWVSHL